MSDAPDRTADARDEAALSLVTRIARLPPAERQAALDAEPDPALRAAAGTMLATRSEADASAGADELPVRVGPYAIVRELGRGGMGVVYEAQEQAPRRRVALKVLHPWLRSAAVEELARHEAQALADVHHPGIPSIFALHDTERGPVVAMELVEGLPLGRAAAGLDLHGRLALLVRLCEAVDYAHQHGITHRDLKPGNVLVTATGQPKVLDFGIAWRGDGTRPARAGTPAYMAPEQKRGEAVTPAADVHALGVLAWEMLTGARPAPTATGESGGATWRAEAAPEAPPPDAAPPASGALREDLRAVLLKARDPDPFARYPNAGALGADLRACLDDRVPAVLAADPRARLRATLRRHPRRAALAASLALAVAGTAIAWPALRALGVQRDAAGRLAALVDDPRGPADPDVSARLGAMLADPTVAGTPALAEAWRWRAATGPDAARGEALAAAWIWAGADDAADRAALARALAALPRAVRALGPYAAADLAATHALARWTFDDPAARPWTRWLSPFARASRLGDAGTAGALLAGGRRLEVHDREVRLVGGEAPRTWTLPGPVARAVTDGERFAAWGAGPWLALGPLDGPARIVATTSDVAAAVLAPGGAIFGLRYAGAGVYRVGDGAAGDLHPASSAEALPVRDLDLGDLDGDGAAELVVSATGWRGHDLRVLALDGGVRARLRSAPWSSAILPSPDGARLWVLGGALPEGAAPRGDRTWLAPVRLDAGGLAPGAALRLPFDGDRLVPADLDGDGWPELLVDADAGVGIVDPTGALPFVAVPGLRLLDARDVDGDPADELWVRTPDGASWLLGAGTERLPAPEPLAAVTAPPSALATPALRRAWTRAATLAAVADPALVAPRLVEIWAASDASPEVAAAALALVSASPSATSAVADALGRSASLTADARAGIQALRAQARGHADDDTLAPGSLLDFDAPLPEVGRLGPLPTARKEPLQGRLALDLLATDGPALTLPLADAAGPICADLVLEIAELDWSAGLTLALGEGPDAPRATFLRVGGGESTQHLLALSAGGATVQVPYAPNATHRITACFDRETRRAAVRIDRGAVIVGALGTPVPQGPLALVLSSASASTETPYARARIDVVSIRLRGARLADPPGDPGAAGAADVVARRAAEGDPVALAALLRDGPPTVRAAAAEALGRPADAPLARLSASERRALLRRGPATWGPLLARGVKPAQFAADWMAAWSVPLEHRDPWAEEALRDASLERLGADSPAAATLALARARAMLSAGRAAPAAATLAALGDRVPEARLVAGRLALRLGDRAAARAALERWMAESPATERARDVVLDDPHLAELFPERTPTPRWSPEP